MVIVFFPWRFCFFLLETILIFDKLHLESDFFPTNSVFLFPVFFFGARSFRSNVFFLKNFHTSRLGQKKCVESSYFFLHLLCHIFEDSHCASFLIWKPSIANDRLHPQNLHPESDPGLRKPRPPASNLECQHPQPCSPSSTGFNRVRAIYVRLPAHRSLFPRVWVPEVPPHTPGGVPGMAQPGRSSRGGILFSL